MKVVKTSVGPVEIKNPHSSEQATILTSEAVEFVAQLHGKYNATRLTLLENRKKRQKKLDENELPTFLKETEEVRKSNWQVAPIPPDLQDRRVEITGPVERKMMINALNSGAKVFMADFEDSLSPTWNNVLDGQINCYEATRRTLTLKTAEGKTYSLNPQLATLVVRPRGWHLSEDGFKINGESVSGSLFDFGLYFFHNAAESLKRGTGPYFYLPKMESHLEARLWNDVFCFAQDYLKVKRGSIKATVLIETILAAFEMDEIIFELKEHMAGLNAGRWDYIFSCIKKFRNTAHFPDRSQITMTVPFMRAYTELLVQTCHRRGAHAMGGMAAFIPSRKDKEVNERAISKVLEDKEREARDGFDGTWVAHPDLVPVAMKVFDKYLGAKPNQKDFSKKAVSVQARELIDFSIPNGTVSPEGVANNISVGLQYLQAWLSGSGAVGIFNLMEDAATAEISRAELWLWLKNKTKLTDGTIFTKEVYLKTCELEIAKLDGGLSKYKEAKELLDSLVLTSDFAEFLTLPAYKLLQVRN